MRTIETSPRTNRTIVLRAHPSTYAVPGATPAALFLLYLYLASFRSAGVGGLVVTGAILALFLYVVRSFALVLSPEALRYRAPFHRERRVTWPHLRHVSTGVAEVHQRSGPRYYVSITRDDNPAPLIVNIKPFARRDLAAAVQIVKQRAPHATFDQATEALARHQVPSPLKDSP